MEALQEILKEMVAALSAQERRKKALPADAWLRQLRLRRRSNENPVVESGNKAPCSRQESRNIETAGVAVRRSGPSGWRAAQSTPSELQFRVDNSAGHQVGSASISVVGPAVSDGDTSRKSVGGVSTSSLRREVIDQMIQENGWVVNDYQKEIGGRDVYVVVAQSQAKNGAIQSRMFYFTEVDGRIYNVATNSPVEEAERLAEVGKGDQFAKEPRSSDSESVELVFP